TIGFKLNWERLLAAKGLTLKGYCLRKATLPQLTEHTAPSVPSINRHKTALTRYDLSKPVKTLMEYGLLKPDSTIFDYGCGQGGDVSGLRALGYKVDGWDPSHCPSI